ncbi:MAG TPA: hypothetical protein VGC57_04790 [Cellulomonas sp.]
MTASPAPHPRPRPDVLRRPGLVVTVGVLVLLEAVLLVGLAVVMVVALVRGSDMPGPVVFLVLLAAGAALLLAAAARGLWQGRRWARSPVMTWQILLVVLAIGWLGVETAPWSVGVLVVAVVTGVALLLPPVVAWTTAPGPSEPDAAVPRPRRDAARP